MTHVWKDELMLFMGSVVGLNSESLKEFLNVNTHVLCTDRLFLGDPHALR